MQKYALYLSITLAGISTGILTGLLMDILDEPLALSDVGIFFFSIPINAVLLMLFAAPLLVYLRNITKSLTDLNAGKTTHTINPLPLGLFANLTDAVNVIINNQQEFQLARGNLYEQISEVAAQEERKRLARDLHDSIKQQIFSMSISASAAHAHLDNNPTAAREALIDVKQSAQEAMVEMRALLQQLSPAPLDKSGLIEALREQCEALGYRTGAQIKTHFGKLPSEEQLPTGTQAVIFRIAQEALSNIARHARAKHVELKLSVTDDENVMLEIIDDGQGFDTTAESSGMGLNNMKNRAESILADLHITSSPTDGTQLTLTIPLVKSYEEENMIFEEFEPQRKAVLSQYWLFTGAASATIFSSNLLLWRMISRSDEFLSGSITQFLLFILGITFVIGLPMIFIAGRQSYQSTQDILSATNHDRRTASWLKRHRHMMQLVIALVAAMFVPQLAINPWFSALAPVAIGLIFVIVGGWHYVQMYSLYREEVYFMPVAERIEEMDKRLGELRTSWLSLFMLLAIQIVTLGLGDSIQFPPQNADHWITFTLVSVTIVLFINQILSILVYRQWRDDAQQERTFA